MGPRRFTRNTPLGEELEAKARTITRGTMQWDTNPAALILRQIALTREEIILIRNHQQTMLRELLKAECAINTGLMQRYPEPGERGRLQGRLFTIETERRRLAQTTNEQLRVLHQQLLTLLNKYQYLDPCNEY